MADEATQDPGPAVAFRRGGEVWVALLLPKEHWWQLWRPRSVEVRLGVRQAIRFYQTLYRATTQVGLQLEDEV
jgi:hypothetical protein